MYSISNECDNMLILLFPDKLSRRLVLELNEMNHHLLLYNTSDYLMEVTGRSSADWLTPSIQQGPVLDVRCRRVCFARWSLRMKRLWQTGQTNFFSPVWVRRWRDNSSERANFLSQPSHLHLKGFSPAKKRTPMMMMLNVQCAKCPKFAHWLVILFVNTNVNFLKKQERM